MVGRDRRDHRNAPGGELIEHRLRIDPDDIADGPDAVDHEQLELAVELLRDVSDYAEDKTVDETLSTDEPLGQFVAYVLEPDSVDTPKAPYAAAAKQWDALERFVESRLRPE